MVFVMLLLCMMCVRNYVYVYMDSKVMEWEWDEGDEDCVDDEECVV